MARLAHPYALVSRKAVNRTVGPKRPPNRDLRTREYLTEAEVQRPRTTGGPTKMRP